MLSHYDILIAGGGLIGSALALSLANTHWQVALVEAQPAMTTATSTDGRAIALSYTSQQILQTIGLSLPKANVIKTIHISEQGQFGSTLLNSATMNLPALGYVVPIMDLYRNLQQLLITKSQLTIYQPAVITAIQKIADRWQVRINDQWITTYLLIAADGEKSFIRQTLNIPVTIKDYQQTAVVSRVTVSQPSTCAYERFTKKGIVALLPLPEKKMAVIWTLATAQLNQIDNLLENLQQVMGYRVGQLTTIGQRYCYPLRQVIVSQPIQSDLILLGNAAHALHPVAAQGLNLGLRDVFILTTLLKKVDHLPHRQLIDDYLALRLQDQQNTQYFSEQLIHCFTSQRFLLPFIRGISLSSFDLLPSLKNLFSWQRMGSNF